MKIMSLNFEINCYLWSLAISDEQIDLKTRDIFFNSWFPLADDAPDRSGRGQDG